MFAYIQNVRFRSKYSLTSKMFAPMKCSLPNSYYSGSAESPTSVSFSVRLKSSLSDGVASPPCSPQVGICSQTSQLIWAASLPYRHNLSKYLRSVKISAGAYIFTISNEKPISASKCPITALKICT